MSSTWTRTRRLLRWSATAASLVILAVWISLLTFELLAQGRVSEGSILPYIRFVSGHVQISVPLWIPLLVVAVPTAILWWVDRPSSPSNCCPRCGYDASGNASGICPECGYKLNLYPRSKAKQRS
jgi:hypothetical protein